MDSFLSIVQSINLNYLRIFFWEPLEPITRIFNNIFKNKPLAYFFEKFEEIYFLEMYFEGTLHPKQTFFGLNV